MRAAGFSEPGGPEVLRVLEVATPQAGPGQVRVRVRAAGVQPFDCAVRSGWTPPGVTGDLPRVPGNEFAGVIDQGESALLGTEVLGFGALNAYAEYIVVPAEQVVAKPAGMAWEVAGGFSAGAQTAHIALETLGVAEGETLVVHAAAGGVGTAAVQLAVDRGVTVIGTGRPASHEYLRELGAIPVAYGDGLLDRIRELAPAGVDAALDGAGGDALAVSLELVADRGRILTLVEHGGAPELGIRVTPPARSAARLAELVDLHTRGRLRIHVRATYPLERAADAHRDVESRHGLGKVVITVD
ncbi:NADP-dependent oxidoreductase [Actinoplanes sp. HUAS TT8]|uniref:NADP-dependent oxidoreductase n=1 Tax=Actinoplanes sp. HUAS TT8 TaxID=3447453 RepID=UPI003F5289F7